MRCKLEFLDHPDQKPSWFDSRAEAERSARFLLGCPIEGPPLRLRLTEYGPTKIETLTATDLDRLRG
jgi:hypothetical protein